MNRNQKVGSRQKHTTAIPNKMMKSQIPNIKLQTKLNDQNSNNRNEEEERMFGLFSNSNL